MFADDAVLVQLRDYIQSVKQAQPANRPFDAEQLKLALYALINLIRDFHERQQPDLKAQAMEVYNQLRSDYALDTLNPVWVIGMKTPRIKKRRSTWSKRRIDLGRGESKSITLQQPTAAPSRIAKSAGSAARLLTVSEIFGVERYPIKQRRRKHS